MTTLTAFQPLDLADRLAKGLFGITLEDAIKGRKCIKCKRSIDLHSYLQEDVDEYLISGFCRDCFSKLCDDLERSSKQPEEEAKRENKYKLHIER